MPSGPATLRARDDETARDDDTARDADASRDAETSGDVGMVGVVGTAGDVRTDRLSGDGGAMDMRVPLGSGHNRDVPAGTDHRRVGRGIGWAVSGPPPVPGSGGDGRWRSGCGRSGTGLGYAALPR
ncbi:hypothetical protein GCM10009627_07230 [Curtobacterium herbarum]|uniref:Uncharacterized protein n=1 Tax=Curtobacterium herbarum TaxID=150122 RepID=A0ABN1ZCM4_9MICO